MRVSNPALVLVVLPCLLSCNFSTTAAFQTILFPSPSFSPSHLMMEKDANNNNSKNINKYGNNIENEERNDQNVMSRRSAITKASLATSAVLTGIAPTNANAFSINPFTPLDRQPNNNYEFTPAKRATSYLVDSTIPPTLVPFKAQREAAILKGLGGGSGTPKTPYIEESLNLNNMMNKGVFGTIDFVKNTVGSDDDGSTVVEGEINDVSSSSKKKNGYDATFVFLGIDYNNDSGEDAQLAIDLISDITKPRRGLDTAIALSGVPISLQRALNEYMSSTTSSDADEMIINTLVNDGQMPKPVAMNQLPILQYAKAKQFKLIATSPEPIDVLTVRTQGLQNVDPERRSQYVADAEGFINWTQEQKNKLYTERSLLKDWTPLDEKETAPGGFFAEKILVHETIATRMANYAFLNNKKSSLVINIAPIADVRFLGGPNGRIARICKAIKPSTTVDEEAVTTILINPSAEETLSQSKFLRLEIGTGPSTLPFQTKVADYLWFSSMPKVNLLPRLMNG